ncbi:Pseudouridine synthase OS=Tsukamurella paurometabola (strain ATCC 8368 / DSM / CCUG 35730 /CIP 100753 / JCM 10117 / KCTC 9821 / NBRC 16120 / NCIMB 702349/ NCTC 13040) OX=521096 GN=Tpau_4011 PE=4 SV=1 [Tsukamurella paurometabola]|uniref:RNA pseudouridylate synthase n=1 Tax=Tsukamurella paurometabola (strain ATCC 8368 / DSM 20162 / CCUG 35730 / CIP 100753 / JCM 10117 / KCTC 9821 / NBRC 16120 / NCIMB 702349 / NCTC 13040) TaxID=521096 RepID=D5UN87_TSUPD|nr:pseudouridine synthase [Tsukamurella paurometabola]ADG80582.1 pseudouridine synthase [Tsukamurella paurometabola DSM 20162]SUP40172.1 Ribosomal large subunit pseudouridine synthase D [Tsukamurella paurometabola]
MARRRHRGTPVPPLPLRDGVDATRLVIAEEEAGHALGDVLQARFPGTAAYLAGEYASGSVVTSGGAPLGPASPVTARQAVWLYRELPHEVPVPFPMPIIHADDRIVVVDKPHFLATMPRGARVVQSALVRLRRELGEPSLSPAHRLDRLTAGVLLFTRDPAVRGPYQQLFAQGLARKEYAALAPLRRDLELPATVESRIEKTPGIMRAYEVNGPVNARSHVELEAELGTIARYRLRPETGKTHQLRLHMSRLGVPILGDPLYPEPREVIDGDFTDPLRLLARRLAFVDPIDGAEREFVSSRELTP